MQKRAVSSRWQNIFGALGSGRREERRKAQSLKRRTLHLEALEDRHLLSVLYWDPQQSGSRSVGGPGTWTDGGDKIWWDSTQQHDVAWDSSRGDVAAFAGAAGAVTVASGVSAGGIEFDTASYSLAGVGITLTSNNNSGWLGGEVRVNSTADAISAPLAGSVGLTKTGSGTLTLTGASTYSGTTAIQNGTLAIATASDRLPTGTTLILGGSTTSGVLQLGDGATGYNQTVAELDDTGWGGEVVGGGSNVATLTVALADNAFDMFSGGLGDYGTNQNENNLRLKVTSPGPNHSGTFWLPTSRIYEPYPYSGGVTVASGELDALNPNTLGSGPLELAGGTFFVRGTLSNDIIADAPEGSYVTLRPVQNLTLNGDISGAGAIHCENGAGASATLNLNGDNQGVNHQGFTGTFKQSNGPGGTMTTRFTSATAASSDATWQIDSGTLAADVSGTPTIQLGALGGIAQNGSSGTLTNAYSGSAVTFEIGGNNQSTEFDGTVTNGSGTVALTKTGTGTLTLAGNNTYTGGTTINGGTLEAKTTGALPGYNSSGKVIVGSGGTMAVNAGTAGWSATNIQDLLSANQSNFNGGSALGIDTTHASTAFPYDNIIGGSLGLTKLGSGTLILSNNSNSYTGSTTLAAGILNPTSAGAIGTGTINFSGGTLQFTNNNTADYSPRFSIAANQAYNIDTNGYNIAFASPLVSVGGTLTKLGMGWLTLSAINTYTGTTTINHGILALGNRTIKGTVGTGGVEIAQDGELDINPPNGQTQIIPNQISGLGNVIVDGNTGSYPTTVIFTNTNDYSGGTDSWYGTLQVGDGGATGTLGSGEVTLHNSTLTFDRSYEIDVTNVISASSQSKLVDMGTGTVTLSGDNASNMNGCSSITINAGATLRLGGSNCIGTNNNFMNTMTVNGILVLDGNPVTLGVLNDDGSGSGTITSSAPVTLTVGEDSSISNFSGKIQDGQSESGALPVALTKIGSGTLTLSRNNTYSGGTTITAGTLIVGTTIQAGSLGTGTVTVISPSSLILYSAAAAIANNISGSGQLTMSGPGVVTLTGNNTYGGSTTISQGELLISGSITSDVTVASGATLSGTGTTGAVTDNGTISPSIDGVGTLNTGNIIFHSGAHYDVDVTDDGCDQINVTGTVDLTNGGLYVAGTREDISPDVLVILKNDGTDLITGTFSNLAEGASVLVGSSTYTITYRYNAETYEAGTGNDVALIRNAATTTRDDILSSATTDGSLVLPFSALGLQYLSSSDAQPIVSVDAQLQPNNGTATLVRVETSLNLGGVQGSTEYYNPSGVNANSLYRFSSEIDASSLATGRYDWTMTITEIYSDNTSRTNTYEGFKDIRNWSQSRMALSGC